MGGGAQDRALTLLNAVDLSLIRERERASVVRWDYDRARFECRPPEPEVELQVRCGQNDTRSEEIRRTVQNFDINDDDTSIPPCSRDSAVGHPSGTAV